jgi:hypothetical protein
MTFEEIVSDEKVLKQVQNDFKKEIALKLNVSEE